MNKVINEYSKSISEIFNFIELIEGYLKNLEKRISVLEQNEKCDDYDK